MQSFPSCAKIVQYWVKRGTIPIDPDDPECFACKEAVPTWGKLERCHIIARSISGSSDPGNFVLLCKSCHREAPMTDDPQILIKWILDHPSWVDVLKTALDVVGTLDLVQGDFTSEDRIRFARFMAKRQFDSHPQATRAELARNVGLMMREYIELKRIISGPSGLLTEGTIDSSAGVIVADPQVHSSTG